MGSRRPNQPETELYLKMAWPHEVLRRMRVTRALRWNREYPSRLPNPGLRPIDPTSIKRIEGLNSVCLFLGPYRNLTTLTASLLFLHPNCQVLNHAGSRILENEGLDFLSNYSVERFNAFCHYAITMSQGGARGSEGGSIVLSHAVASHQVMRKLLQKRYGAKLLKSKIQSLVWKESELVGQIIRSKKINLAEIFQKNPKLRFLMPIRNPIDCASSIVRWKMDRYYKHIDQFDIAHVLEANLAELRWFTKLKREFPNRFYYFYQDQIDLEGVRKLALFLDLEPQPQWCQDVLTVYKVKSTYEYGSELLSFYDKILSVYFGDEPEMHDRLRELVRGHKVASGKQ